MCWCAVKKLLTLSRCHSFFWLQDATCVQKHTQSYTVKQSLSRWNVGRSVAYLLWRLTDAVPNANRGNRLLDLIFVFIPGETLVAAHRFHCIGSLTSVVLSIAGEAIWVWIFMCAKRQYASDQPYCQRSVSVSKAVCVCFLNILYVYHCKSV